MSGFTQLPNSLWDRTDLNIYDRCILIHIIRKTIGWGKKKDGISLKQFTNCLGVSKNTILKSTNDLINLGIITKTRQKNNGGGFGFSVYELSETVINHVNDMDKGGSPSRQGVVHRVNKGGSSSEHTKDTITKDTITKDKSLLSFSKKQNILEVFNYWQDALNHPNAKLDAKREKLIGVALKMGYSIADLQDAIDGLTKSEFHMGKNDRSAIYDSIGILFKDADKIDGFIKNSKIKHKDTNKPDLSWAEGL